MTTPFKDLAEVLGAKPKQLPIKGRMYSFPPRVSDSTGAKLAQMSALGRKQLRASDTTDADRKAAGIAMMEQFFDGEAQDALWDEVLGDAQQEMLDNAVPPEWQQHVFGTLLAWHMSGEDAAVAVWEDKNPGEAPAPNRATRRRAGSASGGATRSRGSSSGTSPRKAASKRAAGSSRGGKSSSTGR